MLFILLPGAWAGAWIWDEVAGYLRNKNHEVHTLTLSGLDGSAEPSAIDLNDHVEDVESYIQEHGAKSVILVGHSYSGIVAGQVASRGKVSVRHTIFIEAFLPVSGQSLLEVSGLPVEEEKKAIADNHGMWPAPGRAELITQPELNDVHIELLTSNQQPQPGKTVTEPAELNTPLDKISATFIAHKGWLSFSREQDLLEKLQTSNAWQFREIDGGHWPMLTIPRELSEQMHSCIS